MRKTILVLSVLLNLVACSENENDSSRTNGENLIGTWSVTKIVYENSAIGTIEPDVVGNITFNVDGTGRENYTYTVLGVAILNISNFSWKSTNTQIIFDEGTTDEAIWERLQNTLEIQIGRYNEATGNTTITITIEK